MPSISHATVQGSRSEQQDRYVIAEIQGPPAGTLLAVMDGHGGTRTAEIVATHIAALFQLALAAQSKDPLLALKDTVQRLVQRTSIETSGSSLSAVFIPQDQKRAYTVILGDSPVLIQDAKQTLWIGPLHNVRTHDAERASAIARGGIYRGGYLEDPNVSDKGLQLTRALGDRDLTRVLNREPDVFSFELGKESWILLATDGVLNGSDLNFDRQLRDVAKKIQKGFSAQEVVDDALRRQTEDNVTLILWKP